MAKISLKKPLMLSVDVGWPVEKIDQLNNGVNVTEVIAEIVSRIDGSASKEVVNILYGAIHTCSLIKGLPQGTFVINNFEGSNISLEIPSSDQCGFLGDVEKTILSNVEFHSQVINEMNLFGFLDILQDISEAGFSGQQITDGLRGHDFIECFIKLMNSNGREVEKFLALSDSEFAPHVYSILENQLVADLQKEFIKDNKLAAA